MVEKRNAYRVLVGKPEGRRTRHGWENNIRICLAQIGLDGMDWIHKACPSESGTDKCMQRFI